MVDDTSFTTSISADKAAALKQAVVEDYSVTDRESGYFIEEIGVLVRPQDAADAEGPWTVIAPHEQGPTVDKLLQESTEEPT